MAKRKGKSHETQTAEAVTDTVKPAVSPEHAEQSAAPVVAGDDRAAGAAGRGEHADGAPPAAGLPDATAVGDGAGEPDPAPAGEAAEGLASETPHESGEVSDDTRERHNASMAQQAGQPGAENAGASAVDPAINGAGSAAGDQAPNSAGRRNPAAGNGGDAAGPDTPATSVGHIGCSGRAGVHDASAENADLKAALELAGCKDLEDLVDMATIGNHLMSTIGEHVKLEGPLKDWAPAENPVEIVGDLYDMLVEARTGPALCTCPLPRTQPLPIFVPEFESGLVSDGITLIANDAGCHAHWLLSRLGVPVPDRGLLSLDQGQQLYEFVAKIRESATPTVLASQLVILKHRQTQDINWAQSVTLEVFAALSMIFLKREDEIVAEQRALLEAKGEPVPVPIDETTMEPVDDPLATTTV
ncbi:hypothetical protein [Shinella kummerowiae]|uniref:hypothetical protein n=1 Tax=Shinella kummerowiae TaxID=417745 RepID=UPI0021B523F3|nr:hypothetical protein [Shinella kummerowiae]MCT7662340.1 hypothetical protein [Shinella kummerowiae]